MSTVVRVEHFPEQEIPTNVRRAHIVVADDDPHLRALVVAALRQDRYDITEARDGHELLEHVAPSMLFDEATHPPDLIITDLRMPGVDGLSVLAGLRDTGWATPIIVITAHATERVRADAKRLGADAFFRKPFDLDDLRTVVLNLLGAGGWRAVAPTLPDLTP